jgi:hypothetical protein
MGKVYDFVAENEVPFRAVIGENHYGHSNKPVVTFYDRRYPHTENGQHTGATYYLDTLMDDYERLSKSGLCLHGGVPDWQIGAREFRTVANWILEVTA